MADKVYRMTAENKKKLEDELYDLKINKTKENTAKIKEAKGQGDLSENAEYDAARDEQAEIQGRIQEIEAILKNVEIVSKNDLNRNAIDIGSTVKVLDVEENEEIEFKLVAAIEADSGEGKLSIESPLGVALHGKKSGQTVTVEAPVGEIKYKILSFTAPQL
jgi:transcription elongation factor GreA